jgi:hypothetical protein
MATDNRTYLDVDVSILSQEAQVRLAHQRQTYLADKAAKAAVLVQIQQDFPLDNGQAIVGAHYNRWGQFQVIIDTPTVAKPKASARPTLAAYMAAQAAQGRE